MCSGHVSTAPQAWLLLHLLPALVSEQLGANSAWQSSAGIAAMKPGEPGQGKYPSTSSCWAPTMRQGSGCPTLLLALLGLLGTPAAHGEYGHIGCTVGSSETCPAPPSLFGGWGGRWHHHQTVVIPGMQPSTVPLLGGKSRAALLGCSLGLGNGEWDPHPKRFFSCTGDCGPPPHMAHSKPSVAEQPSSFPVGSRVTYTCLKGAIKIPGRADMVQCLPGSRWSQLPEPCGRKYPFLRSSFSFLLLN